MLCAFAPAQASESAKKEGAVSLDVPIPNLTLSLMVDDRRVIGRWSCRCRSMRRMRRRLASLRRCFRVSGTF